MKEETRPITMLRQQSPSKPFILKRNLVVFFCFSGCFIDFLLRFNLSVAMVEIVKEQVEVPCSNQTSIPTSTMTPTTLSNFSDDLATDPSTGPTTDPITDPTTDPTNLPCFENRYNYDKYWTSQFLAAYFYGLCSFFD